jgi:imidazole glycerol-phosphate synthase subunit HisH
VIVVVDYGMGNVGSIANMLKRVGANALVSSQAHDIERAEKLILPGVGAFDSAMERINGSGLRAALDRRVVADKVPVLGICLGMQLLTHTSEEGELPGLGWIAARTVAFRGRVHPRLKSPHMGWNLVVLHTPSPLTTGFDTLLEPRFYFVHSYFIECDDSSVGILRTTYGVTYDSAIQRGNIYGVQFHPEKSHRFGMRLLENFAQL